jgi:hypothetical protein
MATLEDAAVGVVETLRTDQDVLDTLYVDTTVPSTTTDRDRVYVGAASRSNTQPVEIAVMPIADTSSTSKSIVTKNYVVECTVVATEPWYDRYQSLQLLSIFDAVDDLNVLAPADNVIGQGRASSSDGIETETDTGRRVIGGNWQYFASHARY